MQEPEALRVARPGIADCKCGGYLRLRVHGFCGLTLKTLSDRDGNYFTHLRVKVLEPAKG